jgi:sugar phosphate isomerase/epimerase
MTVTQMKLGISTLYLSGKPFHKVLQTIETNCKECNIWELIDEDRFKLNKQRIRVLKELQSSYGLKYTIHGPFSDFNIASINAALRKLSIKAYEESLSNAAKLDAKMFVIHPGFYGAYTSVYPGLTQKLNLESINHLAKVAGNLGVPIAVENMPTNLSATLVEVKDFEIFFKKLSSIPVGLVLDVGHANTVKQLQLFIKKLGKKITHIHLHSNNGNFDTHSELGEGDVDWVELIKTLKRRKYSGHIIIESVFKPFESYRKIRKLLLRHPT